MSESKMKAEPAKEWTDEDQAAFEALMGKRTQAIIAQQEQEEQERRARFAPLAKLVDSKAFGELRFALAALPDELKGNNTVSAFIHAARTGLDHLAQFKTPVPVTEMSALRVEPVRLMQSTETGDSVA
jgi:hypothetical protein